MNATPGMAIMPRAMTAADITPKWLTVALAGAHPGVRVSAVEVIERHEVTNAHARLRLTYENAAGAPDTVFCKLPPTDPARRATIAATGGGSSTSIRRCAT